MKQFDTASNSESNLLSIFTFYPAQLMLEVFSTKSDIGKVFLLKLKAEYNNN